MKIKIAVKGNPKPYASFTYGKPRGTRIAMQAWKKKVAQAAASVAADIRLFDPIMGEAVRVDTHFYIAYKNARIFGGGRGNPDLDNLRKATIDGLQEVIIEDDAQIIAGTMSKQYVECRDGEPFVLIVVTTGKDLVLP
jgi:Holliday junction resolvase RusA-like endonuclease